MKRCFVLLALLSAIGSLALFAMAQTPTARDSLRLPPLEPAQAEASFIVQAGFRMDLLGAEPLLTDPVAGAYDADGRLWVVEMNDYPFADKKFDTPYQDHSGNPPLGKVRILSDEDGDGRFDRSSILAEGLSWPSGIVLFDGGAYVTATPDIWYLKDADGDGQAEIRERVFTGFKKFNVQAVINNLAWGPDFRIYGAGASNGGQITSGTNATSPPVTISRQDFCFDPRTRKFELLSGGARFGNTFDDAGNRFICNIRNPAQHVVLPARYLARNPFLPLTTALQDVCTAGDAIPIYRRSPPEPWRVINAQRLAASGTKQPRSETHASGFVTSSSGLTIYRGSAYPASMQGNLFFGEVSSNVIHREAFEPLGPTFRARPTEVEREFVASTDTWFRPVNFVNAPDGTLHVLDMYRETIEHPWSIPDDLKARLELTSGRDRGRVYRLTPPGFERPQPPRLSKASTAELISQLGNASSWWRETAARLLFERRDLAAVPLLRAVLQDKAAALAALPALELLNRFDALTRNDLLVALDHPAGPVRRAAIELAESRLADDVELRERVLALADDSRADVRLQAVLSLGEVTDPRVAATLGRVLWRDRDSEWQRAAVLSARPQLAGPLLQALPAEFWRDTPALAGLLRDLSFVVGAAKDSSAAPALLELLTTRLARDEARSARLALIVGLGQGARRGKIDFHVWVTSETIRKAIDDTLVDAKAVLLKSPESEPNWDVALARLALEPWSTAKPAFEPLLDSQRPQTTVLAAVRAVAGFAERDVADVLLERWPGYTPAVRVEIVEALLGRPEYLDRLLDAFEARLVPTSYLTPSRQTTLRNHARAEVRERITKLLAAEPKTTRQEIVKKFQPALALQGDTKRGLEVYQKHCAACHRLGERGHDVGPNLLTIQHRGAPELLVAILDPNREVGPNFVQYVAQLDDGRTVTGLVVGETPASITLKRAENQQETLLRQNIEQLSSTGVSLMPEGVEQKMTEQELADLLALLRGE